MQKTDHTYQNSDSCKGKVVAMETYGMITKQINQK